MNCKVTLTWMENSFSEFLFFLFFLLFVFTLVVFLLFEGWKALLVFFISKNKMRSWLRPVSKWVVCSFFLSGDREQSFLLSLSSLTPFGELNSFSYFWFICFVSHLGTFYFLFYPCRALLMICLVWLEIYLLLDFI